MKNQNHYKSLPSKSKYARNKTPEFIGDMKKKNSVLNSAGDVPRFALVPYANPADGIYGIGRLILSILESNKATFPKGIENDKTKRSTAIAASLFAKEIIAAVRMKAGPGRYPDCTIRRYISCILPLKNLMGKIKLTSFEDWQRPCPIPRTKYYLIKQ